MRSNANFTHFSLERICNRRGKALVVWTFLMERKRAGNRKKKEEMDTEKGEKRVKSILKNDGGV